MLLTNRPLDVLICCEFSAIVREAFRRLGHNAVSCDLIETEIPGPHVVGDALAVLKSRNWDLVIAHPPCTYLTNSGVRWLYGAGKSKGVKDAKRWADMEAGAAFFRAFFEHAKCALCVENPIMHGHGLGAVGDVGPVVKQTVQPYEFGHLETKATVLWLRGLPALKHGENVEKKMRAMPKSQTNRVHLAPPGPDRWKMRSRTFPGIAEAMAAQWGGRVVKMAPSISANSNPKSNEHAQTCQVVSR